MKKWTLFLITTLLVITGSAQQAASKLDLRFGIGSSLLGTGDMQTIMFENELNVHLNNYITLGGGLGYARSDRGIREQASFTQLNANIYISPFKNTRKNDFRLGTGASWYAISDVYESTRIFENGQVVDVDYVFEKRNSIGFNVILENTYLITEKYMLGVKLFTQPYQNGDINSGVLVKFGVNL
ncbi:MAG: hypothetical protein SF053_03885 [Bacteroidia bacterium]|nr:hypothetical protein [Bacteroidia bacterium]